jgi:hypothetical protein
MPLFKKKEIGESEPTKEKAEESEVWTGQKWEYKIEPAVRALSVWAIDPLNKLGEKGWEAVGIVYDAKLSQTYILFKRPKT